MKKRYRTTAIVGVVFAGLLVYMMLQQRGRVTEKGEYFSLQLADISQIQVQAKDYKYTMARRGEEWWITQPFEGLMAKDTAKQVVQAIAALKPQKREGKNLQDPEFGLDAPQVTVTVTYKGNRTAVIRLGKQSPLGSMVFSTISNEPTALFLINQSFLSDVDKDPETMREKKLVADLKTDAVKQITIQRGDETVTAALVPLAKETTWRITAPRPLKADKAAVEAATFGLSGAEAVAFMPYTQENLATTGLDKPRLTITVTHEGSEPTTIYVGGEGKHAVETAATAPGETAGTTDEAIIYATCEGRPEILMIRAPLFTELNKGVLDLRDKHILQVKQDEIDSVRAQREQGLNFSMMKSGQEWQVTAPKTGKASSTAVSDLLFALIDLQALAYPVENGAEADLDEYGLNLPQATITVGTANRGKPITIWIGAKVPNETERYYARTSLATDVYEIDGGLLRGLPETTNSLIAPAGATGANGVLPGMPAGMPPGMPPMAPPPGGPGGP